MPTEFTKVDVEVLLALAENDMNMSKTSRALFMHRNNIDYHIRKVRKLTGLNPMKFYDLCKLIRMIEESSNAT